MNTDPLARYRHDVEQGKLTDDAAQRLVVERLGALARRLASKEASTFSRALFGWGREKVSQESLQGLYTYGPVGRGKSMLMQLFVDASPVPTMRAHFHDFMQGIQSQLATIRQGKTRDPIDQIAASIAKDYKVLALDEMQIENIADAMIVGRLFQGLFARGVVLVTTSNRHPRDLYKSGLNRARFLPFIDEISKACEIIALEGVSDYRRADSVSQRYVLADDEVAVARILALISSVRPLILNLNNREWRLNNHSAEITRVSFENACQQARGAADYQALAEATKTVWIEDVPILDADLTSAATRFVTMIDIFYEMKTKIYMSVAAPIDQLHSDKNTAFVFERTLSRLREMDSEAWNF